MRRRQVRLNFSLIIKKISLSNNHFIGFVEESTTVLTKWAEKMVEKTNDEIRGWSVSGVSDTVYQVHDFKSGGIVDLREQTCSCKYLDLTGLPCGHVIMVLSFLRKDNCGHLALDAYKIDNYQNTYEESVYPLPEARDWEVPHDFMVVNPPLMDKRQAGRPRNTNRIPSQGEEPIRRKCSRCGSTTHTARNCSALVPMRANNSRRRSRNLEVEPNEGKKPNLGKRRNKGKRRK